MYHTVRTVAPLLPLLTLGTLSHGQSATAPGKAEPPMLEFDFPEVHIGVAENPEGPTGVTVFYFPEPVRAVVDVRGGSPGVINAESLRLQRDDAFTNAVCFAGGSSYGLSAATGVANALKDHWADNGQPRRIADVTGAIIFDLGERRLNTITPDDALGRAAFENAKPGSFPLGPRGAGRFAMQGWFFATPQHSGQGAAFRQHGETKVAVFTIVNSYGAVVDREGRMLRCGPRGEEGCGPIADALQDVIDTYIPSGNRPANDPDQGTTSNTTLTLLVTNEDLPAVELKRLAIQTHTSMSRAIQPFSTSADGDILIAVTTAAQHTENLELDDLAMLASEVAWDAVLSSVPTLPERGSEAPTTWTSAALDEVVGTYAFSPWFNVRIERIGDALLLHTPSEPSLYFGEEAATHTHTLTPIAPDTLLIEGPRGDRLRFDRDSDDLTGLTMNPGPWEQRALRH